MFVSTSHHIQNAFLTNPKFDFTVLYSRDHLDAWSVVFAALLLIQGPLTASVWTKQNGTNAKEKFQVTKQTARHGASRLKSWWQLRDERPFCGYECLVEHDNVSILQVKHRSNEHCWATSTNVHQMQIKVSEVYQAFFFLVLYFTPSINFFSTQKRKIQFQKRVTWDLIWNFCNHVI